MKYIYLDANGNQVGPVDQAAVEQEILAGRLKADSAIRNALLKKYDIVENFECFAGVLAQVRQEKTGVAASARDAALQRTSWFTYLKKLAEAKIERQETDNALGQDLHPGDAPVSTRILALIMDVCILGIVFVPFFGLQCLSLRTLGEQDQEEVVRQTGTKTFYQEAAARGTETASDENTAGESGSPQNSPDENNTVSPNAYGGIVGRVRDKLSGIAHTHDSTLRQEAGEKNPKQKYQAPRLPQETVRTDSAREYRGNQPAGTDESGESVKTHQVTVAGFPGGGFIKKHMPAAFRMMECRFAVNGNAENATFLQKILPTGCAVGNEEIRLRIGNDIRIIPKTEFVRHFSFPVRCGIVITLLYYLILLSVFAQTAGMWFWGIFLTRSRVAEALPLRVCIYSALLLIFGILMIPAVLITGRSAADWLCGVRQIRVGSVSRS